MVCIAVVSPKSDSWDPKMAMMSFVDIPILLGEWPFDDVIDLPRSFRGCGPLLNVDMLECCLIPRRGELLSTFINFILSCVDIAAVTAFLAGLAVNRFLLLRPSSL